MVRAFADNVFSTLSLFTLASVGDIVGDNKITHPLDRFSKLDYSTARSMCPSRNGCRWLKSCQELPENVLFGAAIIIVVE